MTEVPRTGIDEGKQGPGVMPEFPSPTASSGFAADDIPFGTYDDDWVTSRSICDSPNCGWPECRCLAPETLDYPDKQDDNETMNKSQTVVCPACHGKLGQFVLGLWRKCIRCNGNGWVNLT